MAIGADLEFAAARAATSAAPAAAMLRAAALDALAIEVAAAATAVDIKIAAAPSSLLPRSGPGAAVARTLSSPPNPP